MRINKRQQTRHNIYTVSSESTECEREREREKKKHHQRKQHRRKATNTKKNPSRLRSIRERTTTEKEASSIAIDQCVGSRARTLVSMPEANIECGQPHQFTLVFGRVTFHFF